MSILFVIHMASYLFVINSKKCFSLFFVLDQYNSEDLLCRRLIISKMVIIDGQLSSRV